MKAVHIWGRELGAYARSPLGVVVPAAFLLLSGYFFYSELVFFVLWGGESLPNDLWRFVFLDMRLLLLVVVPLVTMKLFAEERKLGTIELLWTYPVADWEIVAGKFLAALSIVLLLLAPTILYPCVLALLHPVEPGPLVAAYLGIALLGAAFVACGMAASSLTESQLASAVLTYAVLLLFWFLTWNEAAASEPVMRVLLQLSLFDRFYGFAGGLIETKDVAYFVLFSAFFLFLTIRVLQSRNWRGVW
jgi:ABC-2 type transport system permease protein